MPASTHDAPPVRSPPGRRCRPRSPCRPSRELLDQLDRIRADAPARSELREVKDYLIGVFPLRFETTGGVAAAIEPLAVYGLDDEYWQTYRGRIEAVTPAETHAVARELIDPDPLLILLSGDASTLQAELDEAAFGPMQVVPAE